MNKAQYFHKPKAEEIKRGKTPIDVFSNVFSYIEKIQNTDEYFLRIKKPLHGFKNPKEFFRNNINYFNILVSDKDNKTPHEYRKEVFSNLRRSNLSGYRYLFGDKELRVSLNSCVQGAKLYSYIQNFSGGIKVDEYFENGKNGAQIIVEVPSRTPKKKNHKFKFISLPVNKDNVFNVVYSLRTEGHNCEDKLYTNLSKQPFNLFDDHEIAAYFGLIDFFRTKKENIIPLEMCLFVIPTNKIIKLNKTLEEKVVIEKMNKQGNLEDYTLTEDIFELVFWEALKKYGYMKTFFRKSTEDGLLKDAKW